MRECLSDAIVPWGGKYIACDLVGGVKQLNANDIQPLRCLHPHDKRIDWVYRNGIGTDYGWRHGDKDRIKGWFNTFLLPLLLTVD